jgi:hypothetical protein
MEDDAMSNLTLNFDEVLTQFERALLSPVIPGELTEWSETALRNTDQLQSALADNAKSGHEQIFEEIAANDPEMLPRIERLEAEDDSIAASVRELIEMGRTIRTMGAAVNSDEDSARKSLEGFVKAAESLYVRIKRQELAIEVWLQESQTRDRGVKD